MNRFFTVIGVLLLLSGLVTGKEIFFMRTPAISPDAQKIVFSYENDLWMVNAAGGTAFRLTGMEGSETLPRFSPDGKWLAFSGTQEGNSNVYVMPVQGGEIKQLTFNDSTDMVDSWSWDSRHVYFASRRYNNFSQYKVNREGGTPVRLFSHFFNTIHGGVEHPKTGAIFFTDSWESFHFPSRKRYKGDFNPDIKSYNFKTKTLNVHTTYRGKDFLPTIDKNGNVYFVSDRHNGEFNLYRLDGKDQQRLTAFDTSIRSLQVSANGEKIVFVKDYRLFLYDVAAGTSGPVHVSLFQNDTLALEKDFNTLGKITAFDVSPDGKKLAFVSRGELFISDIKGKFVRRLNTARASRILEVKWLGDSRTLLYNRTVDGWMNLFTIRSDKNEPGKQLTADKANNRNISLDSDRKQAVCLSGSTGLKVINLETFKSKTVVKDEFWGFYNSQPYFSPDDRYIVYCVYRNFEEDIQAVELATGKVIDITPSGFSESNPFWSPDGKYIYFNSERFTPNYPRGTDKTRIFRLPLYKFSAPFKSAKLDKLFAPEEKKDNKKDGKKGNKKGKKDIKKKPPVTIDTNELYRRWERISLNVGGQERPYVTMIKDKTVVMYNSNHGNGKNNLWVTTFTPFEKPKTKKIKGANGYIRVIAQAKDKYYALVNGKIGELNPAGASFKSINISYTFRRNLRDEFSQMFDELWAGLGENFYDHTFHGIDWNKVRKKYRRYLPHVSRRSDLKILIDHMMGELNASHLRFYSDGDEEKTYHSMTTMAPGLLFTGEDPYVVKKVVPDSAADKKDIDIKPGDRLTAVNGQTINRETNREFYFRVPASTKELELTFKRKEKTVTVKLHPGNSESFQRNLYDNWIRENMRYVDKKGKNRIAYVHMKNMSSRELSRFLIHMTTKAAHRDGLILDLRYNRGGNVHDAVLQFLSQRPYFLWKYRGGKYSNQPHFAPAVKPIVLLINEQSLSDAEVTACGFKELKLGTVIGTETYRWIIFTSGKNLVDGSFYRLPSWGCYTLDKKDLEMHGVKPDIYIKNTVKDRLEGKDPQLDAAIKKILEQLK